MPIGRRDPAARRAVPVATLGAVAGLATLAVVRWLLADGTVGLVLDGLVAAAAIAGTLRAARRARPGRSRRGWRCNTAGLSLWLLAPLAWLTPLPDAVATTGRAGFVLLTGAACWFTAKTPDVWSRVRLVVDGAIGGAALFIVGWHPLFAATVEAAGSGVAGAAAVAVPLGAVATLTLFASVTATEIPRCRRAMPRWYIAALAVTAVSDLLWVRTGRPLWAVGFACIVLATQAYRGTSERRTVVSTHPGLVYAPYAALLPAIVTIVVDYVDDGVPEELAITAVVTGVLLIVRQQATLVENRHLVERLEATERRLRHQAMHDSLTGLGGRALLHDRLEAAAAAHRADGTPVAVIFIDLDDFKQVNDVYGHAAGDHVLVAIARRLGAALERGTQYARAFRMSGDEFAVLLRGDAARDAAGTARAVLAEITAPVEVDGRSVSVGGSVGVAVPGPDLPAEPSALLRAADVAMYGVKHAGKGGVAQATE